MAEEASTRSDGSVGVGWEVSREAMAFSTAARALLPSGTALEGVGAGGVTRLFGVSGGNVPTTGRDGGGRCMYWKFLGRGRSIGARCDQMNDGFHTTTPLSTWRE
jgi:hypothetical protein